MADRPSPAEAYRSFKNLYRAATNLLDAAIDGDDVHMTLDHQIRSRPRKP